MTHPTTASSLLVIILTTAVVLSGCEEAELTFTEVKRVNEEVKPGELRAFFEIVDHLPDRKLPPFPDLYLPLPNWNAERTLPISDLVHCHQVAAWIGGCFANG
jgi:hypothetical protein